MRINIYHGQNNDIDIKNGVNAETNGIDGVKNGTNGIGKGVDEKAYIDKDLPEHIQKLLNVIAENPTETQAQYNFRLTELKVKDAS